MYLRFKSPIVQQINPRDANSTMVFEKGDVVSWEHDVAEAERIVAKGIASKITELEAAQYASAGKTVITHPHTKKGVR